MELRTPMKAARASAAAWNLSLAAGGSAGSAGVPLLQIQTLVLWLACLAVGGMGFWVPYPRIPAPAAPPQPVRVEAIDVEVARQTAPPPDPAVGASDRLPPAAEPIAAPAPPPLPAVAAPGPAISLALPVHGPVRLAQPSQAAPVEPAPPVVQRLTYGQGEAAQPAPEYPRQAILAHEQGIVGIRFTVGEDGRVLAAAVSTPSHWPDLDQSALRAVRDLWQFRSGPPRTYEVSIRFHLNDM